MTILQTRETLGSRRNHILTAIIKTAQNSAIRTAIDMGVFEKIPFSGDGITLDDLSAALGIDKRLLGKL